MIVNIIGNYDNGIVGETGDINHIAREIEALGHTVQRVPQDIWREVVRGDHNPDWAEKTPLIHADINIICKWHHFDGRDVTKLREVTNAPVFLWVWDMMDNKGIPDWHMEMVKASDLYLGNDVRSPFYSQTPNAYYFPFDVSDGDLPRYQGHKTIDVAFFGSWIGQGDRQEWLREINKTNPITVFSWNYQDWPKEFKNVNPAVYGEEFARKVGESKIVLGFSVEPNVWGYWSNRVGKVLTLGGFLLYQYAPGMELFLRDGAEYFSSTEEAREKIDHYLLADTEREDVAVKGRKIGERFTSKARVKDLMILAERFLKKGDSVWRV